MDIEAVVPSEIIAMILHLCDPADVPAVRGVCARWRDLAPEVEPDLVLAVQDNLCIGLYAVPRARVKTPFLDRLRTESSQMITNHNDSNGDNFHTMMGMCSDVVARCHDITLWCLFANLRRGGCKAQLFAVDFDEDDLEYGVMRFETKCGLAVELMDWARSALDMTEDDGCDMLDLDTDEGLAVASATLEKAQRIWI